MAKDSKLTEAKRQWALDGRLLTGRVGDHARDRLPPGQTLTEGFPVLDLGAQPEVGLERFRLDIDGAVRHPLSLRWDEFMALPQSEMESDIHCVTQWSRFDNRWRGVAATTMLDEVQPLPDAAHVILHGYDGYMTNIRLGDFASSDVILAYSWQGEALTAAHGGPLRLIVPRLYLWKSAKWLRRIEFSVTDRPGFWERNGYHNEADPWLEERYDEPEAT